MVDMTRLTKPKSDQLNADDLIGRSLIIKITQVREGNSEQRVIINYEGDNGKPYKPCVSMCRLLMFLWGNDGSNYVGKKVKLVRDPSVKWAGIEVGGIRISEVSGISERKIIPLTASQRVKKPYSVEPLNEEAELSPINEDEYKILLDMLNEAETLDELKQAFERVQLPRVRLNREYFHLLCQAKDAAKARIEAKDGEQ